MLSYLISILSESSTFYPSYGVIDNLKNTEVLLSKIFLEFITEF